MKHTFLVVSLGPSLVFVVVVVVVEYFMLIYMRNPVLSLPIGK